MILLIAGLLLHSCTGRPPTLQEQRDQMIHQQLAQRGVKDTRLLEAFRATPREEYILPSYREHAYDDVEAPIGHGQSIDRPYENAIMLQALDLKPSDRVLEVGTGSGYLASLMSKLAGEVFTIEIDCAIADEAKARILRLAIERTQVRCGDGYLGWPEQAPFNAIVLTASPSEIPQPLIEQLAEGGRLVLPLGGTKRFQELKLYEKKEGKLVEIRGISHTEFVPMKGKVLDQQ
jgi:protein-L-isoaspartate(D-aspartate) O-methyltransferase